jgi:hypothetical protein
VITVKAMIRTIAGRTSFTMILLLKRGERH